MHNKYLFTGISSQLGKSYLRYLSTVSPESKVMGLTSGVKSKEEYDELKSINKNIELIKKPTGEKGLFQSLLSFYQPNVVANFGALTSVGSSDKNVIDYINVNLLNSIELMETVRNMDKSVRPVIVNISSSEIYGNVAGPVNECSCPQAKNAYGASKAALTIYSDLYTNIYNTPIINMVTSNFISEHCGPHFIFGKLLNYVLGDKEEKLKLGNTESVRDWMYADDLIEGIELLLRQKKYGSFCISSGNISTINGLIKACFEAAGIKNYKEYITIDKDLYRPNDTSFIELDCSLIKSLGWEPKYKLNAAIEKAIERKSCGRPF